jgi:hypothetical protein
MDDKKLVTEAIDALLVHRDAGAVDRYFGPRYFEHSPLACDGTEGLREWAVRLFSTSGSAFWPRTAW